MPHPFQPPALPAPGREAADPPPPRELSLPAEHRSLGAGPPFSSLPNCAARPGRTTQWPKATPGAALGYGLNCKDQGGTSNCGPRGLATSGRAKIWGGWGPPASWPVQPEVPLALATLWIHPLARKTPRAVGSPPFQPQGLPTAWRRGRREGHTQETLTSTYSPSPPIPVQPTPPSTPPCCWGLTIFNHDAETLATSESSVSFLILLLSTPPLEKTAIKRPHFWRPPNAFRFRGPKS